MSVKKGKKPGVLVFTQETTPESPSIALFELHGGFVAAKDVHPSLMPLFLKADAIDAAVKDSLKYLKRFPVSDSKGQAENVALQKKIIKALGK